VQLTEQLRAPTTLIVLESAQAFIHSVRRGNWSSGCGSLSRTGPTGTPNSELADSRGETSFVRGSKITDTLCRRVVRIRGIEGWIFKRKGE